MAEFGERATQLSPPQGAGAAPIGPVTAGLLDNGVFKGLANIADIFEKGLQVDAKAKAQAQQQAVVGGYAKKLGELNDAATTGQLKPSEVSARRRALHSEYVAGYSQYVDELDKVSKSFSGTEIGAAEDKIKTEQELRKERISAAQKAGFPITEGMGEATINSMVDAHQTAMRADEEFQRYSRKVAEERASGRWSNEVTDREMRTKAVSLINQITDTTLNTSSNYAMDIGQRMRSGKITPEIASAEWASYMVGIEAQIQAASSLSPDSEKLAGPYRSLFNDLKATGAKFFDPSSDLKQVEDEVKLIIGRQKLIQLSDPNMANLIASSQMLGANSDIALRASGIVPKVLAQLSLTAPNAPGVKPQLVGNPEVEKQALGILKGAIEKLNTKAYKDEPKAREELTNSINNTLAQVGESLGKTGVDAKYLANVAEFLASSQYGKYASETRMDATTLSAATNTFDRVYKPTVVEGINRKLDEAFKVYSETSNPNAPVGVMGKPINKPTESAGRFNTDNLQITFTGSGVDFNLKTTPTNIFERQNAQQVMDTLTKAKEGVNQLIHIGAHMEGNTDYAKYWEANKHIILPRLFSKYEGLEIGQAVNGKTYLGGDARDATNWK